MAIDLLHVHIPSGGLAHRNTEKVSGGPILVLWADD